MKNLGRRYNLITLISMDMDCLFFSNNSLVAVSLPSDFKVPKEMFEGQNLGILSTPPPIRHNARRLNARDRYAFHEDGGHKTEECTSLKDAIVGAICNGELNDFMAQNSEQHGQSSTISDG
ncbi:hypothetical protein J1N35_008334 [Gossypium stocksii]|uniref:Uncharacterized protein n=1 Tax=Gossypium stocksii TaxID=47602 RepID=A0A9D3W8W6_9ROSI|nr:hypothetical protein J1N35_008334 [Gossypium stocksii]